MKRINNINQISIDFEGAEKEAAKKKEDEENFLKESDREDRENNYMPPWFERKADKKRELKEKLEIILNNIKDIQKRATDKLDYDISEYRGLPKIKKHNIEEINDVIGELVGVGDKRGYNMQVFLSVYYKTRKCIQELKAKKYQDFLTRWSALKNEGSNSAFLITKSEKYLEIEKQARELIK